MDNRLDAIYARQSVDRIDSISTQSQVDLCMKEVHGSPKIYIDKGYSGKNIDRPQFQALLSDINHGFIKRVVVYRLDRISRSVLDFSTLIQNFQQHNVEFVSTMEKFDTASPIGKAMLMIVMVFAQLERETIQQRVADAYRSRSRKGFYMGGKIPFGYRLSETTLNGVKTKMYVEDEHEIQIVNDIFHWYASPQVSFGDIVNRLNQRGVKNRMGKSFSRSGVRDIVINPIYARFDKNLYEFFQSQGVEIVNCEEDFVGIHGGYLYSGETKKKSRTTHIAGQVLVLAPHEGSVRSDIWMRCRKKCLNNKAVAKPVKAKATWLAGKLKCGYCGYALTAKIFHCKTKNDNRYYLCSGKYSAKACDQFASLKADQIDEIVYQEMVKKLSAIRAARSRKTNDLEDTIATKKAELNQIDQEITSLLDRIAMANATVMEYINKRVSSLEEQKQAVSMELSKLLTDSPSDNAAEISGYLGLWESLSMSDKIAVVDCIIESISATKDKLSIKWKI